MMKSANLKTTHHKIQIFQNFNNKTLFFTSALALRGFGCLSKCAKPKYRQNAEFASSPPPLKAFSASIRKGA